MSLSDRLDYLDELIYEAYRLSKIGHVAQSNDYYVRAFMIADNLYNKHDHALFTDEELKNLKYILDYFND